ncbi:hypothetical protein CDAR_295451 [Caerostris darwini]|uniref:Uncharacterized protein n=1 Tax=Caerostris darwini TaxID=1538125 RepID=A0AAV4QMX9_9ARAC|nr:hypothetical protein CDAR_295451 [Caerostris darwini]
MDIYRNSIFSELQSVHETGYYNAQLSLEDRWQQSSRGLSLDHAWSSSVGVFYPRRCLLTLDSSRKVHCG